LRDLENFDAIRISIASPEEILSWSHGEIKKPETINYRTHKPERDGLFCEKIFGPTRDWECFCGKFRSIRYKGVVCERCGVEVTRSKVRRERMGHITLAAPVAHIWFVKGTFSYIALLLDISPRDLEKVIYFNSYVVVDPGNLPLMEKQLLSETDYRKYRKKYGDLFDARMGAEAVKILLQKLDVNKLVDELKSKLNEKSGAKKQNVIKRLQVTEMFLNSESQPEWMIMDAIPVIPPDLRPMVQLDGGRFATSDLNDLYRRVINRNNRLKRLLDLEAPEIIIKNEKRMLQEAVNSLIDNGRRGRPVTGTGKRPLKSLNDMLTGKQGRFRENLLGKRVDYSGRSVIVVGPSLKLHQCGLPKKMALELFKPFIMNKLVARGVVTNIKSAKKLMERNSPEVLDVLEEVIKDHPVLLNRAPTLHRLGIQAFIPTLTDGKAIQIHPLVCTAFNADFDGDQMAVHIPLLTEAQVEARLLMMSTNNLFSPANGKPIAVPSQDMAIGCYYLTRAYDTTRTRTLQNIMDGDKVVSNLADQVIGKSIDFFVGEKLIHMKSGEIIASPGDKITAELLTTITDAGISKFEILDEYVFPTPLEAIDAYETKSLPLTLHEKVWVRIPRWKLLIKQSPANIKWVKDDETGMLKPVWVKVKDTDPDKVDVMEMALYKISIGRLIFNENVPEKVGLVDQLMDKGRIAKLIETCYKATNNARTCRMLDDTKTLGFKYATVSGLSIAASDLLFSVKKTSIIDNAKRKVEIVDERFRKHQINREEKRQADIDVWISTTDEVTDDMLQNFKELDRKNIFNSVYLMAISGARGNVQQIRQLAGMRGLMSNPHGDVIDFPITSNFRDGLTVSEYFISTFGARKGLVDTALRTADSGYLTRRLVDVAQDVIVSEENCGTSEGIEMSPLYEKRNPNNIAIDEQIISISKRVVGRVAAENVVHPLTGEIIVKAQEEITDSMGKAIERAECLVSVDDERIIGKLAAAVVTHPKSNAVIIRPDREITPFVLEKMRKARVEEITIRPRVVVRSPIACRTKLGICRQCYSRDLSIGRLVNMGEAAGVIAAQSIGEPGTQLTMRTFHIGGIALSKKVVIKSKIDGIVSLEGVETVWKHTSHGEEGTVADAERLGNRIVLKGHIFVENRKLGRKDKYNLPSGSILKVKDGDDISAGDVIVEYNPNQIVAETGGTVTFNGVVIKDGTVVSDNSRIMIDPRDGNRDAVEYSIPQGALLKLEEGDEAKAGDIIAEATSEQKSAISGIDGTVEFFNVKIKNNRVISENGLVFVIPYEKAKRVTVGYTLQKGIKDTKESVEAKKAGLQLRVKNGNEVKYNDELIVITSEIDGIARISEKKGIITVRNMRAKEYLIPKSDGVKIDRAKKVIQWIAEKDGVVDILAPKASTNKTSDSRRVIVNQEVTHKVPVSCQLYTRDLKVLPGKTIKEGEKLTKPIHLKTTINGLVKVRNEFDDASGLYTRFVEISNIMDVDLNSREEISDKVVGRKVMRDIINRFTGDVIAEKHAEDRPSIITESLIDSILLRTAHSGRVDFPDTRVVSIDASTDRESLIGLMPLKAAKFSKAVVPGRAITADVAEEIILAKGSKKEIEVNNDMIFIIKETDHDMTEAEKIKKVHFLGQIVIEDVKYKGKKLIEKGTVIDEKVFRIISENMDKVETISTRKISEYRVPLGATPRYRTGDKVGIGSELVYPTQLNELVILEGEETFEIPQEGELKVADGERIKAGDDIIKPMESIVATITGLVNYDTRYDKRTGEDLVEKIIVYTGYEYNIPSGITLKIKKQSNVKKGDPLTEEVMFDDIDETHKKEYRIIRREKSEKKYKITPEMELLIEDKDKVRKNQKIAVLKNFKYISREEVIPQEDEGTVFFVTNYSPVIKDTLKLFQNDKEVALNTEVNLNSDTAIRDLCGMRSDEEIQDRDGKVIVARKSVFTEETARNLVDLRNTLENSSVHVVNPEIRVIYTTGEIFFKNRPEGSWKVQYASEVDGVVKLLKRKTKEGKERTTIGEIVVQSGEAHQIMDGGELKVDDAIVPVKTKIPFHARLNERVMAHTVFNVQTGEIIVEKGEFTNKGICNKLQKQKARLNRKTLRAASRVGLGTILAKWGSTGKKTTDIIQGLPRVQELFEIRKPKKEAFIVEDDGEVKISGSNILIVKENGERKQYKTQFGSQALIVSDGEIIKAGDPISDGNISPKKLAKIAGISAAAMYLLDEVQQVYRSQGVTIDDKHIEVILRQMMRKVRIKESGDTTLLPQDLVHITRFQESNDSVGKKNRRCATGERILQGITQASLTTESFLSAASFQETTRVLTKAAIESKVDNLRGLKENLIIGKLIPAGTGLRSFESLEVYSPEDQERMQTEMRLKASREFGAGEGEAEIAASFEALISSRDNVSDAAKNFNALFADSVEEEEEADNEVSDCEDDDTDGAVDGK
jgi:DNA-directed RNA polymerase subunit beta'